MHWVKDQNGREAAWLSHHWRVEHSSGNLGRKLGFVSSTPEWVWAHGFMDGDAFSVTKWKLAESEAAAIQAAESHQEEFARIRQMTESN